MLSCDLQFVHMLDIFYSLFIVFQSIRNQASVKCFFGPYSNCVC